MATRGKKTKNDKAKVTTVKVKDLTAKKNPRGGQTVQQATLLERRR